MATAIEIYGFTRDRKPRDETQSVGNFDQSNNESVSIQQQFKSSEGPTTNIGRDVKGDVFSGESHGPVSSGGDALDMRGSTAPIIKPNGPVNIHIGDNKIVKMPQKMPIPRIRPPRSDFVGRDAEMKEIIAKFERGATITGLRGMGGVGKTELALALASKLKDSFPDGQIFLDMLGTSNSPLKPEVAMGHVIRSYLGVDASLPEDLDSLSGLYHSVLSGKKVLILLDNAASREQVESLLPPPGCALLVTSRKRFALPGLTEMNLDILPLEDARKLLLEICERIGEHAEELAKLCGFLPIALRNSAYTLKENPNMSPEGYIERLGDAKRRLELVEASFSTSYELLAPELQMLWSLLSIFPADFDLAGSVAVWKMEKMPAEDALGELIRWSLVDFVPSATGEGGRYRLHDLARYFAESRLDASDRETVSLRHAEHYKGVLLRSNQVYQQGGENVFVGLRILDLEWANILAGQFWAEKNREINSIAASLCNYYPAVGTNVLDLRMHPKEKIHWHETALAAARQLGDRGEEGTHLGSIGVAYAYLGDAKNAIKFFLQHLKIARKAGDKRSEGDALGNLGVAYAYLGDVRQAIDYHQKRLTIARKIMDRNGEGIALCNLGIVYSDLGNVRQAIVYYEKYLERASI